MSRDLHKNQYLCRVQLHVRGRPLSPAWQRWCPLAPVCSSVSLTARDKEQESLESHQKQKVRELSQILWFFMLEYLIKTLSSLGHVLFLVHFPDEIGNIAQTYFAQRDSTCSSTMLMLTESSVAISHNLIWVKHKII